MKKLYTFILLLLITFVCAYSQDSDNPFEIQKKLVLSRTLYVVLDDKGEESYFKNVKATVEKYWKITPYKFITETEFKNLTPEEKTKYAFLYLYSYIVVTGGHPITEKQGVGRFTDKDIIETATTSIVPAIFYYSKPNHSEVIIKVLSGFDYKDVVKGGIGVKNSEVNRCDSPEKVKITIRYFQTYIKPKYWFGDKDIPTVRNVIRQKKLIILKSDLDGKLATDADIKNIYSYKFEIASDDDWKKYVNSDANDVVYLIIVDDGSNGKGKYIFDAATGEQLFWNYKGPLFNKKCFSEILSNK